MSGRGALYRDIKTMQPDLLTRLIISGHYDQCKYCKYYNGDYGCNRGFTDCKKGMKAYLEEVK